MTDLEEYLLVLDERKYLEEFYRLKMNNTDYVRVIEQFQKLLGVFTTTEALAKIAALMREDDTAGRLLSKALGHLHTCSEQGGLELYNEIASAFGEAVEQMRAADLGWTCEKCGTTANVGYRCSWCEEKRPIR